MKPGDVFRLDWSSASGQVILAAVDAQQREIARVECDEADVLEFSSMLWSLVDRARARSTVLARRDARRARSVARRSAAQAERPGRRLELVRTSQPGR